MVEEEEEEGGKKRTKKKGGKEEEEEAFERLFTSVMSYSFLFFSHEEPE